MYELKRGILSSRKERKFKIFKNKILKQNLRLKMDVNMEGGRDS